MTHDEAFERFLPSSGDAADQTLRTMVSRFSTLARTRHRLSSERDRVGTPHRGDPSRGRGLAGRRRLRALVAEARRSRTPPRLLEEADRLSPATTCPTTCTTTGPPSAGGPCATSGPSASSTCGARERRGDVSGAASWRSNALRTGPLRRACRPRADAAAGAVTAAAPKHCGSTQRLVEVLRGSGRACPGPRPARSSSRSRATSPPVARAGRRGSPRAGGALADPRAAAPAQPPSHGADPCRGPVPAPTGFPRRPRRAPEPEPWLPHGRCESSRPIRSRSPDLLVGRHGRHADVQHALERGGLPGGQAILIRAGRRRQERAGRHAGGAGPRDRLPRPGRRQLRSGEPRAVRPGPRCPLRLLPGAAPGRLRAAFGELPDDLVAVIPELRYHLPDLSPRDRSPEPRLLLAAVPAACAWPLASRSSSSWTISTRRTAPRWRCSTTWCGRPGASRSPSSPPTGRKRPPPGPALAHLISTLARESLLRRSSSAAGSRRDHDLDLLAARRGGQRRPDRLAARRDRGEPAVHRAARVGAARGGAHRPARRHLEPGRHRRRPVAAGRAAPHRAALHRLPPSGRETLTMASVLGQTSKLQPLVAALDTEDESSAVAVLDAPSRPNWSARPPAATASVTP